MGAGAYPEVYLIGDPPCTPAGYAVTRKLSGSSANGLRPSMNATNLHHHRLAIALAVFCAVTGVYQLFLALRMIPLI